MWEEQNSEKGGAARKKLEDPGVSPSPRTVAEDREKAQKIWVKGGGRT